MKKKVISYLLCGTMTAAMLLGGCSSDKESDKKNDDKKTSQEADQDKASEKPDSQEEPDAKMEFTLYSTMQLANSSSSPVKVEMVL